MGALTQGSIVGNVFPGNIGIAGHQNLSLFAQNQGAAVDFYTAPAGFRVALLGYSAWNTGGVGCTFFNRVRIAGTNRPLETTQVLAAGAGVANRIGYIAEPGEILSLNITAGANLNIALDAMQFSTSYKISSKKIADFVGAAVTVYTVPAGFNAILLDNQLSPNGSNGALMYVNGSAAVRRVVWYWSPQGNLPGPTTTIYDSVASVAVDTRVNAQGGITLKPADVVSVASDAGAAGNFAWVNTMEVPQ